MLAGLPAIDRPMQNPQRLGEALVFLMQSDGTYSLEFV